MNVEPIPNSDSTVRSPPNAFAKFLLIVKPNPQPWAFKSLWSAILVNTENNESIFS